MRADDETYETGTETDLSAVAAGPRITLDELGTELAAMDLRLRQLARAAEVPETPVELTEAIDALRRHASFLRQLGEEMRYLGRVTAGDVPLATTFQQGDPWGPAARGTDRQAYGGPAIVPTAAQLVHLAQRAERGWAEETTTYPEHMTGIGIGWESKAATARRRRERDAAVVREARQTSCTSCQAGPGEECRTKSGRVTEQPHAPRQREAEATVDARLGALGTMPVAIPASLR
ncbi:zinc finger domain-containing protein [Streptomyces yaizuensis]|uniref:DNA-binding phage zinc finger domain-containing protein n=1 Tax=Streptomyces yaizuensis TaxID=2989713 RepID=A0AA86IVJ6_9ACTN|nr:hypothetical protein [Streptomyces sp. YSPA8]BDT39480.1 hypothetical protein SYYSPA8_36810 [Streptomyces sp. YSPA8]